MLGMIWDKPSPHANFAHIQASISISSMFWTNLLEEKASLSSLPAVFLQINILFAIFSLQICGRREGDSAHPIPTILSGKSSGSLLKELQVSVTGLGKKMFVYFNSTLSLDRLPNSCLRAARECTIFCWGNKLSSKCSKEHKQGDREVVAKTQMWSPGCVLPSLVGSRRQNNIFSLRKSGEINQSCRMKMLAPKLDALVKVFSECRMVQWEECDNKTEWLATEDCLVSEYCPTLCGAKLCKGQSEWEGC